MTRTSLASSFASPLLALCAAAQPAIAQDEGAPQSASTQIVAPQSADEQDSVLVSAGQGSGNSGRVAVNLAAGSQNQQLGSAVIAIGQMAVSVHGAQQHIDTPNLTDRRTLIALGPDAFSNNSGLLSLNISAGNQNQSANLAALTVGTDGVVSDQMLAQTSAPTNPAGRSVQGSSPPNDVIAIDDTALGGNSGLVQINLVGGERNSSANTLALNVSAGGNP